MNNEDARSYTRYLVEHYGHLTSCVVLLSALDYAKDSLLIETTLTSMQAKNPGSTVAQDYRKGLMENWRSSAGCGKVRRHPPLLSTMTKASR